MSFLVTFQTNECKEELQQCVWQFYLIPKNFEPIKTTLFYRTNYYDFSSAVYLKGH